jgi:hypothetical protein
MRPTAEPSAGIQSTRFVFIFGYEIERLALEPHSSPGTRNDGSSNISLRAPGICRAHPSPADPNWFAINGLASSTSSSYRDIAGGAMRVLSTFDAL